MKPPGKPVVLRLLLLLVGYLAWGALTSLLVSFRPSSGATVYQTNPRPVGCILVGLAGALLVATTSVLWRVARHSARVGVAGMTVAILAAIAALVGMLTVGPFIVPIAAVLVLLALPIPPEHPTPLAEIGHGPPGWYQDPGNDRARRFWDGSRWTWWVLPSSTTEDAC